MVQDSYIELFDENKALFQADKPLWWETKRAEAIKLLENNEIESIKEAYALDYGLNVRRLPFAGEPFSLFRCDIPGLATSNYLVLNDSFYAQVSEPNLPKGVVICSLSEAFKQHADLIKPYLEQMNISSADMALNTLLAQDGMFIYIPDGVQLEKPIQLVNLMYGKVDMMAVSQNLAIIGENAKAQVLVCDHAYGEEVNYLSNRLTQVFVGKNSTYEHYKLESSSSKTTNISTLQIYQEEGSQVLSNLITLANGKTHNRVEVNLNGKGAYLSLNGLGLGQDSEKIENHTFINHNVAGATSNELFKYILNDNSVGDFYGLIKVLKDAQQTQAYQTNRNLCLSKEARMHTRPQLEIYADDVKCNHGATVGQLDENALFYMRARGIDPAEAKMLLMFAFVHDVLDNVRIEPLKDRLQLLIERRLRGDNSHCSGCKICR
ncbi:MAG: Fe-S cluster assembly protein SufD [Paludibacteraceae bacterium]|nr:Fe-S cluster assembly protein SufD [Paludibacteraceae bacterium]